MDCLQKALSYTAYETNSVKLVDGTQRMHERYELRIHCEVALTLYLREHWKGPQKNISWLFEVKLHGLLLFPSRDQGNYGDQFYDQGM